MEKRLTDLLSNIKPQVELAKIYYRATGTPTNATPLPLTSMDTPHYFRFSFREDISSLSNLNPEIWLFRYNYSYHDITIAGTTTDDDGNQNPAQLPARIRKAKWLHPTHQDGSRHDNNKAFWHSPPGQPAAYKDTEFFEASIANAIATNTKIDLHVNGREWFTDVDATDTAAVKPRAKGKKGYAQRFKFALVVDDPSSRSGKRFSQLSDEFVLRAVKAHAINSWIVSVAPALNYVRVKTGGKGG